jgi:NhaA family Na+:H+ antiporter
MKSDKSAAFALLGAAIFGLVLANSPIGPALLEFKETYFGLEQIGLKLTVEHWVSDLLLATFFLVAGLELKYELRLGALSKPSIALVPILGALGGVIVPALIYYSFNTEGIEASGWPIPTATDIAFALGVLAIFGTGLPKAARIFLLALAIFDDLVAILIIAVFYTDDLEALWLLAAAVVAAAVVITERIRKAPHNLIRILAFFALWYLVFQSGVHATIAGVLLGLLIPAKKTHQLVSKLQPWTNTLVLPLFAFFSVAITLPSFSSQTSMVFLGVLIALPFGKLIGITAFAAIANRMADPKSRLPLETLDFLAIAALSGVGFTVSLLMTKLAFEDHPQLLAEGTLAVLLGSVISMTLGAWLAQLRGRHYRKIRAQ